MTELSDLLHDAKGDRSVDLFIADAEKRGVKVNRSSRATIYRALNGEHGKNPREETLQLFADVFVLDIRKVREAAHKPAGELGPWEPVSESAQLSKEQRTALNQLIKTIVRGTQEGSGTDDLEERRQASRPKPGLVRPTAARKTGRAPKGQRPRSET